MATLTLDHVCKIYKPPEKAVNDVSMAVNDGEIIGLLGSSGCGKSSTLRMIAGFESVSEGTIRIGDRVINDLKPAQRNVAMAFEGYALYPPLKIRDNIQFSLLRSKMPKAKAAEQVKMIAHLLQIEDILDRYPPTISGGQQQRASLARALARPADLYLLDEPMSQLEPQLRAVLRARIKDYLIEHNMTSVFVTHDQTEAVALADRIAVMSGGVLQQFATPVEMLEKPSNLFVASFIGEPPMNIFKARITADGGARQVVALDEGGQKAFAVALPGAEEAPQTHEVLHNGRDVYLGIRPHEIVVGHRENVLPPAQVIGNLTSNQWLGDQSHLGVTVGGCFLIAVADRGVEMKTDSDVTLGLPVENLHFFDADSQKALLHGMQPAET